MTDKGLPVDQNWVELTGVNRRTALLGTAFVAGFAAACQPVSGTTKKTDASGMAQSSATVAAADGFAIPLHIARPAGKGPFPVVIVVHEIFGVHEWIKDICRRFAAAGYLAIAPDLFARAGDATKISDFKQLFDTIVSKATDAQVMSDLDRVAAWAGTNGGKPASIGITGFCWGGRVTWLYSAHSKSLKGGVAWYGALDRPTNPNQPTMPIMLADKLNAPVLGLYGGQDKGIPVEGVDRMNALLKSAGGTSKIILYPEADHGFLADYRPSYNEAAATAGWKEALAWFGRTLK